MTRDVRDVLIHLVAVVWCFLLFYLGVNYEPSSTCPDEMYTELAECPRCHLQLSR